MTDIKVVTPADMGASIALSGEGKYEAISQVAFTEREATVDLLINGIQLLFRELANGNRDMVCTGVRHNDVWYGDAPDNEHAQNPFTGKAILAPKPVAVNERKFIEITSDMLLMTDNYPSSPNEIPFGKTYAKPPLVIPFAQFAGPYIGYIMLNVYEITTTGFKVLTNTKYISPHNTDPHSNIRLYVEVVEQA